MYEPRYIITHTILKLIGAIEASREIVAHAQMDEAWKTQFRTESRLKAVFHGTHFEGSELSLDQVREVLTHGETQAEPAAAKAGIVGRDRDVQETLNYWRVWHWIDELRKQAEPLKLSEAILCDLHRLITYRILPTEMRGLYREVEVVVKQAVTGEVTLEPPAYVEVEYQLQELFGWLYSEEGLLHHPVLRAAILQYELIRIHPFVDGSSRAARAMAVLLLYQEGYELELLYTMESYFDSHANDYDSALRSVGQGLQYDLTLWLEFFCQVVAVEFDRVRRIGIQQAVVKPVRKIENTALKQVALSERQIQIMDAMKQRGGTALSADLEEILPMVSVDTILRDLKDMIEKGVLCKRGKTKGAYYELV